MTDAANYETATVDLYELDMRAVMAALDQFKQVEMPEDAYLVRADIWLDSPNDYPIGRLFYEDEQWRFVPHQQGERP